LKKYKVELKPQAVKDGKKIPTEQLQRIYDAIEGLSEGLKGDIKRLTNYTYEYRLRVGNYRVLFEIEDERIVIYRIIHRKESYRRR